MDISKSLPLNSITFSTILVFLSTDGLLCAKLGKLSRLKKSVSFWHNDKGSKIKIIAEIKEVNNRKDVKNIFNSSSNNVWCTKEVSFLKYVMLINSHQVYLNFMLNFSTTTYNETITEANYCLSVIMVTIQECTINHTAPRGAATLSETKKVYIRIAQMYVKTNVNIFLDEALYIDMKTSDYTNVCAYTLKLLVQALKNVNPTGRYKCFLSTPCKKCKIKSVIDLFNTCSPAIYYKSRSKHQSQRVLVSIDCTSLYFHKYESTYSLLKCKWITG